MGLNKLFFQRMNKMRYRIFSTNARNKHNKPKKLKEHNFLVEEKYVIQLKNRRKIKNAIFIKQINDDSFLFRFFDEKFENIERLAAVKRNSIIKQRGV